MDNNKPLKTDPYTGASHGSVKSYVIGFLLSIILTLVPYALVVQGTFDASTTAIAISLFAVAQLFVQLVFFLHLDTSSEQRWNLLAFIFTLLIVAILVVGTLWIMYNLDYNMMDHPMM